MKNKIYSICLLLVCSLLLASCKNKKSTDDIITPARQLYASGINLLEQQKYEKASEEFSKVFLQHPADQITPQAELMSAYALYLDAKYDESIDVLDDFIKFYPANVDIAYAYYLRALCYYMQISNINLDQLSTQYAKISFEDLMYQFPDSEYAKDVASKMNLVNDNLAAKEMAIGRYYLNENNPIAAIVRFQNVLSDYKNTSHVVECLYRLVVCYAKLGLYEDAKKYASILGHNYKDSIWYAYAYNIVKDK